MVTKILTPEGSSWADMITTTTKEPVFDLAAPTTAEEKRIWDAITASTKKASEAMRGFADAAKFLSVSTPRMRSADWFKEQYLTDPTPSWHTRGIKADKVWVDELTDTKASLAKSKWLTDTPASTSTMPTYIPPPPAPISPEERAAREARIKAREEIEKQRARSCEGVKAVRPHLLGRLLSRRSPHIELLSEILNNANFHRERYGYERHQQYQRHLDGMIRVWDASLHDELLAHVRTLPVTEAEVSNDTFGLESPSILYRAPVKVKSDPVDHMPEEWVRDLADQAVRSAKAVW